MTMTPGLPDIPYNEHDSRRITDFNQALARLYCEVCQPEPGEKLYAGIAMARMQAALDLPLHDRSYYERFVMIWAQHVYNTVGREVLEETFEHMLNIINENNNEDFA